jgi:hypothetical protein
MEFKEYGPLAQSKKMATNQKTSWVPLVVMLGLGIVMGIAMINLVKDNQQWNKKDNRSKGI